jgi:hypothetical protein
MPSAALLLLAAKASATPGSPPSGPPTDPWYEKILPSTLRIHWTNGDASAATWIYYLGDFLLAVGPGVTSADTTWATGGYTLRHYKGGELSDPVSLNVTG